MADQQQGDSTLGNAGSGDGAPQPVKIKPVRPDPKAAAPGGGPQDRPGSDPKNPGDFGHH